MFASVRHLLKGIIFLFIICCVAVVGYMIAGWTFIESTYMAIITVFTVGYGEVREVSSPALQLFTMGFIVCECTGYLYIGGALVQFLIEGQIENTLGKRRMSKLIENLNNHTIVCGYGRVGRILATELANANHPFVIIESARLAKTNSEKGTFIS